LAVRAVNHKESRAEDQWHGKFNEGHFARSIAPPPTAVRLINAERRRSPVTLITEGVSMKSIVTRHLFEAILLLLLTLAPVPSHGAQDPWTFLESFQPLPQSATRIAEHYVAVIFVNRDEQRVAAVFFNARCVLENCELDHRAGFAVVDAAGSNMRLYVEPNEEELIQIMGAISV
jgi:hypothetical protein